MHSDVKIQTSGLTDNTAPSTHDPNLRQLRIQIKKVMIPLLIRIFELKLAAQQAHTPPSRLQKKQDESVDETLTHLKNLEEDLKLLQLWCHSCQKQVERALGEISPISSPKYSQKESSSEEQRPSNWINKFLKR